MAAPEAGEADCLHNADSSQQLVPFCHGLTVRHITAKGVDAVAALLQGGIVQNLERRHVFVASSDKLVDGVEGTPLTRNLIDAEAHFHIHQHNSAQDVDLTDFPIHLLKWHSGRNLRKMPNYYTCDPDGGETWTRRPVFGLHGILSVKLPEIGTIDGSLCYLPPLNFTFVQTRKHRQGEPKPERCIVTRSFAPFSMYKESLKLNPYTFQEFTQEYQIELRAGTTRGKKKLTPAEKELARAKAEQPETTTPLCAGNTQLVFEVHYSENEEDFKHFLIIQDGYLNDEKRKKSGNVVIVVIPFEVFEACCTID